MHRKFHKLIVSSMDNEHGRHIMNDCFDNAMSQIEAMLGSIAFSDAEGNCNDADVILGPKNRKQRVSHIKGRGV